MAALLREQHRDAGALELPDRPGDLLELQDGEHDVDKSAVGPRAGGAAGAIGGGGDRVWKDALDPDEQKALKKFFE